MKNILTFALLAGAVVAANAQSFSEGFNPGLTGTTNGNGAGTSVALASGTWFAFNNSSPQGLTGWFTNNTVFAPNSGTGQLNANFNNSTGSNPIDNYFMSMVRTFSAGDTISFFTRTVAAPVFPDRLMLKLSTSGASTSVAAFTQTLLTVNNGLTTAGYPSTYTQFSVTLTAAHAGTGRFAFNYNVPNAGPAGANSDFIGIDDVVYTQAVPEPATMAALGLGVAALLRRRRK